MRSICSRELFLFFHFVAKMLAAQRSKCHLWEITFLLWLFPPAERLPLFSSLKPFPLIFLLLFGILRREGFSSSPPAPHLGQIHILLTFMMAAEHSYEPVWLVLFREGNQDQTKPADGSDLSRWVPSYDEVASEASVIPNAASHSWDRLDGTHWRNVNFYELRREHLAVSDFSLWPFFFLTCFSACIKFLCSYSKRHFLKTNLFSKHLN